MVKTMLIEFTVGNYLSFKDPVTFSMESAKISELEESNIFSFDKYELLKSAVIYGANASGKSNLLKAMNFMSEFISNSSKTQATDPISVREFKLSTETENKPSFFEIVFICDQKKYRYGFEVDKKQIHSEWLFFTPSRREAKLFTREKDNDITIGATYFEEGRKRKEMIRSNALFLSVVAQFNGKISQKILKWFKRFKIMFGFDLFDQVLPQIITAPQLENEDFRQKLLEYIKIADFGIDDVKIEKAKISELREKLREILSSEFIEKIEKVSEKTLDDGEYVKSISTLHSKYDDKHKILTSKIEFDLIKEESEGTQRFFGLLGPISETLNKGYVLVVDELDVRLHPHITRLIIQLFHSKQTNPNNAQLIFATHDTNLLDRKLFRRDQIWFTEKDQYGATDLYSLVEYKNVRKDASFEKDYIFGKYGAVPFIGNFEVLLGGKDE
jgi:uncharacterized protein